MPTPAISFILPLLGSNSAIRARPRALLASPAAFFGLNMGVLVMEKLNFVDYLLGAGLNASPTRFAQMGIEDDESSLGMTFKGEVDRDCLLQS